jgi:hypothetical protein
MVPPSSVEKGWDLCSSKDKNEYQMQDRRNALGGFTF